MSFRALKIEASSESNVWMLRDLEASLSELMRPHVQSLGQRPHVERGDDLGRSDIVAQLESLISLVEESQDAIDALVATASDHEAIVRDLKNRLSEEAAQKDAAYQLSAKAETLFRVEQERIDAAEARAKSAEEKLKSLESREAVVRERVDRLTTDVTSLASAGEFKSPLVASRLVQPKGGVDRAA
jgi:chromosome segregation ATPase